MDLSPQSNKQFDRILQSTELTGALRKILDSGPQVNQRRKDRTRVTLAEELFDHIFNNYSKGDAEIYHGLRSVVHGEKAFTSPIKDSAAYNVNVLDKSKLTKRGQAHAKNLTAMLPHNFKVNSLLDLGCAEGSITTSLREILGTLPQNTYATDITITKSDGNVFSFFGLFNIYFLRVSIFSNGNFCR